MEDSPNGTTQHIAGNIGTSRASSRTAVAFYRVVAFYALLVWAYGAMTAVFKLSRLKDTLIVSVPISRIDTSATAAFIVSALFFFAADYGNSRRASARLKDSILASTLRVIAYYGLLGWLYIVGNSLVHPETLHKQLTHLSNVPTESQFGITCFLASALAALLLALVGWPLISTKHNIARSGTGV